MRTNRKSGIFVLAVFTAIILALSVALIVIVAPRVELTAHAATDEIKVQQINTAHDAASGEQGVYAKTSGAELCLYKRGLAVTEGETTDNTNTGDKQNGVKNTSGLELAVEWLVVFSILLFLIIILTILSIALAAIIIKKNKELLKVNSRLKDDEYCLQIYERDKYRPNLYMENLYADQNRDIDDDDDLDDDDI